MIDRQEILELAREFSLRPAVVEKDYALGWFLGGIGQHPACRDQWIFKGGTCLKKCYFETYRFSEDLDFTLLDAAHINEEFLKNLFKEIAIQIYEKSGLEFPVENMKFELYQNPRGQTSVLGRVGYRGPIAPGGDLPRIKLDLTNDEKVVLTPIRNKVSHGYSDEPDEGIEILCYPYEEIFAEKIRALSERELPRDLYDVVHLHRHPEMRPDRQNVSRIIKEKCEFKGIPFPSLKALNAEPQRSELESEWANMLAHQLPALPPFAQFWQELKLVFEWLEGRAVPAAPKHLAFEANEDREWFPPATAQAWGRRVPLEVIRFAGANHLCVNLGYQGSKRLIEPYSLRRTKSGDLLLHTIRVDSRQHRSYKVDDIESAEVTTMTFTPFYEVELSPSGPIHAPQQTRRNSEGGIRRSVYRGGFQRPAIKYVVECPVCGKHFTRSTRNMVLNQHNDKNGYPCSGRHGIYVDTKYP